MNNQYIRQAQYNKGFANLVLIGVVLVLVVIGGYFLWSQRAEAPVPVAMQPPISQVDDLANWKTYSDTKFGIEAKYPQSWSLRTTPEGFFDLPSDKDNSGISIPVYISITVDNSKKYNSLSDLENSLKSELSLPINSNSNTSSITQKTTGDNNFLVYGWMHQSQGVDYYTLANGNSVKIRFVMDDTILSIEQSKNYPDFLKFLGTLKFTNAVTQDTVLTLKTYTDSVNGFSFQYPNNYKIRKNDNNSGGYIPVINYFITGGDTIVTANMPDIYPKNTDFDGAFFSIATNDRLNAQDCKKAINDSVTDDSINSSKILTDTKVINGVTFYIGSDSQVLNGNSAVDRYYNTYFQGTCYELTEGIRTFFLNEDGDMKTQLIDTPTVLNSLDNVLNTFKFTK